MALVAWANSGFSESTFYGVGVPGMTQFGIAYGTILDHTGNRVFSPFAAEMKFRWDVTDPGDYFSLNTPGPSWSGTITGSLGIQNNDSPYVPNGFTLRDLAISLENETGNLSFDRLITYNSPWPGGDGISLYIPITGAGTFTAITFTVGFDNPPPASLGTPVTFDVGNSSYSASSFSIFGDDGTYAISVVPEPSALSLLAVGLGVLFRRSRKRV